jgi:ribosomal peptide maturation radical SAM protein 1
MKNTTTLKNSILLKPCQVLLVVPPFFPLDKTCISVHILKACAEEKGFNVGIFYANMVFASNLGLSNYYFLSHIGIEQDYVGERFFARSAFGGEPFGKGGLEIMKKTVLNYERTNGVKLDLKKLLNFESNLDTIISEIAAISSECKARIIGFTDSLDQTSSCIAIIRAIKRISNSTIIIGGANCHGEMALGIESLCREIDHVFSGEAEQTFPAFLLSYFSDNKLEFGKIIKATNVTDLNEIPFFNYDEYFEQLNSILDQSSFSLIHGKTMVYETSRGCWKGEKNQCKFCGLSGENIRYREKDASKALFNLRILLTRHPTRRIAFTDLVIPNSYFEHFLPELSQEFPDLFIFYEVRSTISIDKMLILKDAGVKLMQPGIESLSTSHLKKMSKGVRAKDNIICLRNAKSIGLPVGWYILYDVPGETKEEFEEILELLPLIEHFDAPLAFSPLRIDRFSPFFLEAQDHGISNLQPWKWYEDVFPDSSRKDLLAYRFNGDYESFSRHSPETSNKLRNAIELWHKDRLKKDFERVRLDIVRVSSDKFLLVDTRTCSKLKTPCLLTFEKARIVLTDFKALDEIKINPLILWAINMGFMVERDNWIISLIVRDKSINSLLKNKVI